MRNDVKLGFAVGGVLLAVLIVYVLVVPGGSSTPKQVSKNTPAQNDGKVTLEPAAPPAAPPADFTPPAADKSGAVAAKTETAAPGLVNEPQKDAADAGVAKNDSAGAGAVASSSNGASKDVDWNKLLNEPPALMSDTPVKTGAAAAPVAPAVEVKPAVAKVAAPKLVDTNMASGDAAATPQAADQTAPTSTALPEAPKASPQNTTTKPSSSSDNAVASGEGRTHRVQSGETLSSISFAAYGSPNHYPAILRANPGLDPNHLKVGQIVKIPDVKDVKPVEVSARTSSEGDAQHANAKIGGAPLTSKQYRVQASDSLYKISVKLYGKGSMADKIYQLNKQTIGEDPHKLKVGQVLELPEPPTVTASSH
jgi:nucleoid-associated protein YgaU